MSNVSIEGSQVKVEIQTRFSDFDMAQHLNNANYLSYIEVARLEAFTKIFEVDVSRYTGVVADVGITYMKPIKAGTPVSILMDISDVQRKSKKLTFTFVNSNNHEKVYAKATMTQVMFDMHSQNPTNLPSELIQKFERLWKNSQSEKIELETRDLESDEKPAQKVV